MRVINISLNDFLFFINDQESPKNNNPKIRNVFSLKFKLTIFLKIKKNVQVRVITNNGTIFEVINIKISLYFLELNKYFIPVQVLSVRIDEICRVQQGVFVEKILRIPIKIKGKKESKYFFSLLSYKL